MASSHDTMVESRPRELWADNLRVLAAAGVIVVHTATGYLTGIVDWYYDERTPRCCGRRCCLSRP